MSPLANAADAVRVKKTAITTANKMVNAALMRARYCRRRCSKKWVPKQRNGVTQNAKLPAGAAAMPITSATKENNPDTTTWHPWACFGNTTTQIAGEMKISSAMAPAKAMPRYPPHTPTPRAKRPRNTATKAFSKIWSGLPPQWLSMNPIHFPSGLIRNTSLVPGVHSFSWSQATPRPMNPSGTSCAPRGTAVPSSKVNGACRKNMWESWEIIRSRSSRDATVTRTNVGTLLRHHRRTTWIRVRHVHARANRITIVFFVRPPTSHNTAMPTAATIGHLYKLRRSTVQKSWTETAPAASTFSSRSSDGVTQLDARWPVCCG
mmetsp:Transcript_53912/g.143505  ORF Transcript_53912/g.143505 Transcript_53912/m.143505 type:complete len:320 (+) Transcript_53912:1022-1981(+)